MMSSDSFDLGQAVKFLCGLLDGLRHMMMSSDSFDLGQAVKFLLQSFSISDCVLFSVGDCAELLVALGLPDPDVGVLGSGKNKPSIWCEVATQYSLHPLRVIDIPRTSTVGLENT